MASNLDAGNLFKVPNLVAVITGGGTGIGLMMAKALALNGAAKVYIIGRRLEALQQAAKVSPHNNIIPLQCDVTSKDQLAAAAARVQKEEGFINLLIANSGVAGPGLADMPKDPSVKQYKDFVWQNWSMEEFTKTYEVNNTAVFFTAMAFLELLDEGNKRGNVEGVTSQILITASVASYMRLILSGYAYVSSKVAAANIAKSLATMLASYGIRANALAPGLFPSEMTEGGLLKNANEDGTVPKSHIPLGRVGTEEDMAGTTLYLTSKAGAFCNGSIVLIDGGRISIVPGSY